MNTKHTPTEHTLLNSTELDGLRRRVRRAERRSRLSVAGAVGTLALTALFNANPQVIAQSPGVNLAQLVARVTALENRAPVPGLKGDTGAQGPKGDTGTKGDPGTAGKNGINGTNGKDGQQGAAGAGFTASQLAVISTLSLSGTDLTFSGVNVHIVDGTGSTASTSGLGNLIIGCNGPSSLYHQARLGSHNLILGDANNYSSYGEIVCGDENAVGGPYASVLGGTQNLANGVQSSISGGYNNRAPANCASVAGGYGNKAQGFYAVVSGGNQNTASAEGSAVSGGNFNTAGGLYSSISGGLSDSISGAASSISGGRSLSDGSSYGWKGGNVNAPGYILVPTHGTFGSDKG